MQLYNVLTKRKELFKPTGDVTTIYVCGITPYDTTHLGHVFTYTCFDILVRYLETKGHQVRYVQNVTDIDDDIIRKASELKIDWRSLGNRWTNHFIEDNRDLNIRPPDLLPRATDVIDDIIDYVDKLAEIGVAYESAGNVYFEIAKAPDYGQLSCLSYDDMLPIANERGNKPDDPNKRDPLDFVLWQSQEADEPSWDSPWGPGRPGWHIECSTMASKFLGQPVDIHGGGADLLFPHHESEIVQAERAGGQKPFSRFWLHVAMVRYQGEKMSKSLGNLVMVRDLLKAGYSADAIRILMIRNHYRIPWTYKMSDLYDSVEISRSLNAAVNTESQAGPSLEVSRYEAKFTEAMEDDLNTPAAIQSIIQLSNEISSASGQGMDIVEAQTTLRNLGQTLGLRLAQNGPEQRIVDGWSIHQQQFAN